MSKLKTRKSISKRFKISKNNKVTKRKAGQDHFNAKESGNITRMKRRTIVLEGANAKSIKAELTK